MSKRTRLGAVGATILAVAAILTGGAVAASRLKVLPTNARGVIRVTATHVVLYTARGSLSGTGSATLTIAGSQETIGNGRLVLDHGSGTLQGFTYEGTFTGSANLQANQIRFDFKTTVAN